eukprot:PhM_4_TR13445/c0_g1_i1/m.103820/K07950/ARL5B; ADP-ribosylation factor-like protein 5B
MGVLMSAMWNRMFGPKEQKMVIVGLNNAGKTTILYRWHLGEAIKTQPTIGGNVEEVTFRSLKFTVWDLGGQEALRSSWTLYYSGVNAVVLVVDSSEQERMCVVREELGKMLSHPDLESAVVLVFANKQDVQGALNASEVSAALGLDEITTHEWHIQACCALTGDGLWDGMSWIADRVRARS